jgi:hypothetical protein
VYDYIEHTHEISRVNGATDALNLSIGPSAGYIPFLVIVHVLLLFTDYVSSDEHMHMHVVTYITMIFWIKLKLKMSIYPTDFSFSVNMHAPNPARRCYLNTGLSHPGVASPFHIW